MVNDKTLSTKAGLLELLRERFPRPVSGEKLGRILGKSRVAVWKAALSLREAGYPVSSAEAGYRLENTDGDFLYPWEFGAEEKRFRHWASTDSTMNRARELAFEGAEGATVVLSETQSAGRGRNGRNWVSGPGGLFFTLIERPVLPLEDRYLVTMAAHIALARTISHITGALARIRWPNDVYIGNKKAAGLLSELSAEGDRLSWISLGAGVNLNNQGPRGSINCSSVRGSPVSRKETLLFFLKEFSVLAGAAPGELDRIWRSVAEDPERGVILTCPDHKTILGRGKIRGLGRGGAIRILVNGEIREFSSEAVSLTYQ
ncbi:MAG: biotin--[acetyl-CoA-carboxylase] ligase [Treponema sp.]|jgi:BirA family biotin operon repressor/biotin-[acetyl-CoA-carboxylase] ligase|nr:biotin--[acetyl-CoA-carboxylase] ligase [Treponema sp.]